MLVGMREKGRGFIEKEGWRMEMVLGMREKRGGFREKRGGGGPWPEPEPVDRGCRKWVSFFLFFFLLYNIFQKYILSKIIFN